MKKKVNWGILGYADIAKREVIPGMMLADNAVTYAIASRSEDKLTQALEQCPFEKTYTSYEELLADSEIDAVYIPLPNHLHKEYTIKAAKAGKHVLCEKPLALTEADGIEMAEVCKENGVKLMEAFMYRFTHRTQRIQELLKEDIIGEVRHMNSTFRFLLASDEDVRAKEDLGGGSLRDVGCYPINFYGMIMGENPVSYAIEFTDHQGIDYSMSAVLRYENGVLATVNCGFDSTSVMMTELNGTKGTMLVRDTFDGTATPIVVIDTEGKATEYPVTPGHRYELEIQAFSEAILENQPAPLAIEESIRNNKLIEDMMNTMYPKNK